MREAFGSTFDVPPGYLNTPSSGVPPVQAASAVQDSIARWGQGQEQSPEFPDPVSAARAAFAALVGFSPDQVTTGATVSQLVGLVAAGLPDDARVLVARDEFTSVSFPFAAQQDRGVTVTEAELDELPGLAGEYDVVAVSVVQSADGRVVDLDAVREAKQSAGTRVLLDVSQAAGWMPLNLGWADWVVGAQYKWLLALRGAAWMAVRPDAGFIRPHSANWFAGAASEGAMYGLPLRLASATRALDLSPTWFSQIGGAVSMSWVASLDIQAVYEHCVGLANDFRSGVGLKPSNSAIVALDSPDAVANLTGAGVRCSGRAGKTRVGFHLYNTSEDVDLALSALRTAL